jgi:hypothetical protein
MEHRKLEHRQQEQTQTHQQSVQQGALEFGSVEEMLRHDAAQVTPPARLARRLGDSIAAEEPPKRSWWQRLWFRSNEH